MYCSLRELSDMYFWIIFSFNQTNPHEMSMLLKVIAEKQRWLKSLIMQMYFTRVKNKTDRTDCFSSELSVRRDQK